MTTKSEFLIAIRQVCAERGLSEQVVLEAVEQALASAYKRDFDSTSNVKAKIDPETGQVRIFIEKQVAEQVEDDHTQIGLAESRAYDANAQIGGSVLIEATPPNFGRIAAQTAKQVILQRIREAEREALYVAFADREGEIVNGSIQSMDSQGITLSLGRAEAILPRSEQVPGERYRLKQRIRAYVLEVNKTSRGPQIIVSRTHKNMLKRLLELEVPEIYNGAVEIKGIAREPGSRSKVAVAALQPGVDPVGACVGVRGVRIQSIVNELGGEKIDVIEWSRDPREFIAKALSPARPLGVELTESAGGEKQAIVVVPDKQLSLAIGREGQNVRLAARLSGWHIDILSPAEAQERIAKLAAEQAARAAEAVARGELLPGQIDLQMSVEALALGTRVVKALQKAGIHQVGDLVERLGRGDGLEGVPGIGPKSVEGIGERLRQAGLYPARVEEATPPVVEEAPAPQVEEAPAPTELEVAGAPTPTEGVVEPEGPPAPTQPEAAPPVEAIAPVELQPAAQIEPGAAVEAPPAVEEDFEAVGKDKKRKKVKAERAPKRKEKAGRRREEWEEELTLWEAGAFDVEVETEGGSDLEEQKMEEVASEGEQEEG